MSSRLAELQQRLPPTTLGIIGLCTALYVVMNVLLDVELHRYTMNPRMVLHLHEYYRIITSALFHVGLMHIGMNMMSTVALSALLEQRLGTLKHLLSTLWAILLTSVVYLLIAYLLYKVFHYDALMHQDAVGFSGVLFHMSVLEANVNPSRSRPVFGMMEVPSYLYPWVLLIILQLFMPNLSFVGHLAGILTGTMQLYGFFDCLFVSDSYVQKMESWSVLRPLTTSPSFISIPVDLMTGSSTNGGTSRDPSALGQAICSGVHLVGKLLCDVAETLKFAIFGRGNAVNSNIRLWENSNDGSDRQRMLASSTVSEGFEDDDWVGLPAMSDEERQSAMV